MRSGPAGIIAPVYAPDGGALQSFEEDVFMRATVLCAVGAAVLSIQAHPAMAQNVFSPGE